jgi:hypothetical protein
MHPAAASFALFLVSLPLPGAVLALLAGAWSRRLHLGTVAFLSLLASLGITSVAGLLAAVFGVFDLRLLAGVNLAVAAALAGVDRTLLLDAARELPAKLRRPRPAGVLAALALGVVALLLYARPYEWYFGGWDPGIYVNTGASIAGSGSLQIRDEAVAGLTAAERGLFGKERLGQRLKYPGFVIRDAGRGIVQPYFYHLFPVWIAIFDAGFGAAAGLLVGPLFSLAALAGIYLLGTALFTPRVGLFAALLFGLSIPAIWQARFPTSEPLALFFFVGGLLCVVLFLREGSGALALLAGLAFGCALLTKITAALPVLVTLAGTSLVAAATGKQRRWRLPAAIGTGFLLVLPYYYGPAREATLTILGAAPRVFSGPFGLALAAGLLAGAGALAGRAAARWLPRHRSAVRWAASAGIGAAGLFGYFVRPVLDRTSDAGNLVQVGWFLTPLALVLALAGVLLVVHRRGGRDRTAARLLFLGVAAAVTLALLYRKQIVPVYPWALRRFVPEVLPALALFAAVALAAVAGGRRAGRARAALAAALLAATLGWGLARGRHLLPYREYAGAAAPIARVAAAIPDDAVAVCVEGWLATPLHFIHGRNTLQASDLTPEKAERVLEAIAARVGAGQEVFLLTDEAAFFTHRVGLELVAGVPFALPLLEQSRGGYPREIRSFDPTVSVFRCRPFEAGRGHRPERVEVGKTVFGLGPGFHQAETRQAGGVRRSFRWTAATASLELPAPPPGRPAELVLRLGSGRPPGVERPQVEVLLDGVVATEIGPGVEIGEYVVPVAAGALGGSGTGYVTVTLRAGTFVPAQALGSRDERALGVMVESVALRPAAGG